MAFDSTPNPIAEYNRQLLRHTQCFDVPSVTYIFHFEGCDGYRVIPNDRWVVDNGLLLNDWAIERIWNEIAEENAFHFVRGELEIVYPHSKLKAAEVF